MTAPTDPLHGLIEALAGNAHEEYLILADGTRDADETLDRLAPLAEKRANLLSRLASLPSPYARPAEVPRGYASSWKSSAEKMGQEVRKLRIDVATERAAREQAEHEARYRRKDEEERVEQVESLQHMLDQACVAVGGGCTWQEIPARVEAIKRECERRDKAEARVAALTEERDELERWRAEAYELAKARYGVSVADVTCKPDCLGAIKQGMLDDRAALDEAEARVVALTEELGECLRIAADATPENAERDTPVRRVAALATRFEHERDMRARLREELERVRGAARPLADEVMLSRWDTCGGSPGDCVCGPHREARALTAALSVPTPAPPAPAGEPDAHEPSRVAQSAEQRDLTPQVAGSIPAPASTTEADDLCATCDGRGCPTCCPGMYGPAAPAPYAERDPPARQGSVVVPAETWALMHRGLNDAVEIVQSVPAQACGPWMLHTVQVASTTLNHWRAALAAARAVQGGTSDA